MSETDSFIDEVTEEVRRDRLFALMRKYGWIGIVAVLAIVGGAAFNEWQKAKVRAASEGFGDSILAAMESDDAGAALAAIEGVEGAQRAALLQIMIAGEAQKAGKPAEAAAALASVAQDASLPRSLRDLAQLKAVMLGDAAMDAFARAAALEQLAAPGAPYRPLAMEQQALAAPILTPQQQQPWATHHQPWRINVLPGHLQWLGKRRQKHLHARPALAPGQFGQPDDPGQHHCGHQQP